MAREAVLGRAGVAVGMARLAVRAQVGTLEREAGLIVVKGGRRPSAGLVAILAGGGKAVVRRVGCTAEIGLMTREAVLRRAGVTLSVAGLAVRAQVGTLEREAGLIVVKGGRRPSAGLVAILAGGGKAVVRRVGCTAEISLMTREAVLGRAGVAVGVARLAVGAEVRALEGESRGVV
ncbi:MAG: hypothetical protein GY938_07435, partial [Ketobacter sp.]|nr:hypothetical protein [Ketobacter sp.]